MKMGHFWPKTPIPVYTEKNTQKTRFLTKVNLKKDRSFQGGSELRVSAGKICLLVWRLGGVFPLFRIYREGGSAQFRRFFGSWNPFWAYFGGYRMVLPSSEPDLGGTATRKSEKCNTNV